MGEGGRKDEGGRLKAEGKNGVVECEEERSNGVMGERLFTSSPTGFGAFVEAGAHERLKAEGEPPFPVTPSIHHSILQFSPNYVEILRQPAKVFMLNPFRKALAPVCILGKAIFPALVFLGSLLIPAWARSQSLSLNPSSGPPGCLVAATASGFAADPKTGQYGNTGFYVDNEFLAACSGPIGSSGWANCTVNIRMPDALGPHTVMALCGTSASATFTAESPTMSITPTWGPPGTSVTVQGNTFAAVGYAGVYLDGTYETQQLTDESGDFTASFTMPSLAEGAHTVEARCIGVADASFYIITNGIGSAPNVQGNPTVTHPDGTKEPLLPGMPVQMGDTLAAGAGDRAWVNLIDGTQFTVSQNSSLTIDQYVYDPNNVTDNSSRYTLLGRAFDYVSGLIDKNSNPKTTIDTPMGEIGIRGTQFISRQDPCSVTQEVYLITGELAITPTNTPGVTNILDGPVSIFITASSVITNTLTQDQYNAISNAVFPTNFTVTFGSWLEHYFGCTNNNPAAAPDADPDGDGVSNWNEFLAGTDPASAASAFRVLSAKAEGSNLRVSWSCGGGRTNVLQSATSPDGSWSDTSPNIILPGSGDQTTNYLHLGALTNGAVRFYRVRLGT